MRLFALFILKEKMATWTFFSGLNVIQKSHDVPPRPLKLLSYNKSSSSFSCMSAATSSLLLLAPG